MTVAVSTDLILELYCELLIVLVLFVVSSRLLLLLSRRVTVRAKAELDIKMT